MHVPRGVATAALVALWGASMPSVACAGELDTKSTTSPAAIATWEEKELIIRTGDEWLVPTPPLTPATPSGVDTTDLWEVSIVTVGNEYYTADVPSEESSRGRRQWISFLRSLWSLMSASVVALQVLLFPTRNHECREINNHDDSRNAWDNIVDGVADVYRSVRNATSGIVDVVKLGKVGARRKAWLKLAKRIKVRDLDSHNRRPDSEGKLVADKMRLQDESDFTNIFVNDICRDVAAQYPNSGYTKGNDGLSLALFRALGNNFGIVAEVYSKMALPVSWMMFAETGDGKFAREAVARYAWAVLQKNTPRLAKWMLTHETLGSNAADLSVKNSEMVQNLWEKVLCGNVCTFNTCLGLKDNIYNMMVEKTLEAGVDGPAVGLWVTLCLLRMADKRDTDEVCIAEHVEKTAKGLNFFWQLELAAPISLGKFINGYRQATASFPSAAPP